MKIANPGPPGAPGILQPFLNAHGSVILDGGLATELEQRGIDLFDPLWSAKALLDRPDAVRGVHLDYLKAGADVIATASYQATIPGLTAKGLTTAQAAAVIALSVRLAQEARDEFLSRGPSGNRPAPLVAGSIGPYGAYLHDGSEFRGDYNLTERELKAFHRPRLELLIDAGVDLIACETIPSRREAGALVDLLESRGGTPAWISFTARDTSSIADGNSFAECIAQVTGASTVLAAGVNCTPAELISGLLERAGSVAGKPFVVYPNAGGIWDAPTGKWIGDARPGGVAELAKEWYRLGARLIGGCCRTGPGTIAAIRGALNSRGTEG